MKLFDELKWRGLINDVTSPDLEEKLNEGGLTFYIGTDPTGDSLHIGHYSSLLCAKRLKEHGHHPIMLVGGATGFIGDPKATGERNMLTKEVLQHNYDCLSKQIKELFGFEMVNNLDWTKDITIIDFLRDYGKFFNVNYMINKETVKRRLDSGISYTEFSYMLLQALDFLHLYEEKNCTLQLGGQDQWGNITSGLELIRKKHGADVECYGLTMPLILVNSEDAKVIDYLKKLTFLTKEEIDALEEKVKTEPHKREAQKALAKEVVTFLHGEEEYEKALKITNALFRGNIQELNAEELGDALKGFEKKEVEDNLLLPDCLVQAGIASSKREAREWINQGSIQINGEKQTSVEFVVSSANAIHDKDTLIKRGKRNYYVITHK